MGLFYSEKQSSHNMYFITFNTFVYCFSSAAACRTLPTAVLQQIFYRNYNFSKKKQVLVGIVSCFTDSDSYIFLTVINLALFIICKL